MFSYYGAKTKIAKFYPAPIFDTIVEPFAGSARYSLLYYEKNIVLYETFIKPFKVWQYLIQASKKDILSLPDLKIGDDIRNIKTLSEAERWLIGYQLQRGNARPGCIVNSRCRWNQDKIRIANEIFKVKHWKIFNESGVIPDWQNKTYFIDPPYSVQKHGYNHGVINYEEITLKVKMGKGQFIVCGNSDDTWMPFEPLVQMQGISKKHTECLFYKFN